MTNTIVPRLVVRDAAAALDFYVQAMGANETERYATSSGHIVHAQVTFDGACVSLTEEDPSVHNHAPQSLRGSPVILTLSTADPDGLAERMVAKGARVIFPVADQFYGMREGRLRDPFGHVWILSKTLRTMSADELSKLTQKLA